MTHQPAGFGIRRSEKYGIAGTLKISHLEGIGQLREFAVGDHEELYLLDDRADLWQFDRRNNDHKRVFPQGHGLFSAESRIAVSGDLLFTADGSDDRALAAYHIGNGQTVWSRQGHYADGHLLRPLAIASDKSFVYVLTPSELDESGEEPAIPEGGKLALLKFTHGGSLIEAWSDERLRQRVRTKLKHVKKNYFATASPQGLLYVFDTLFARLLAFGANGALAYRKELPEQHYGGICADSSGMIYVGDARQASLEGEDDRYIMRLDAEGEHAAAITSYRGKCDQLLMDGADQMYIWSGELETFTFMDLQPQTLPMPETGVPEGIWLSRSFDSAEIDTVWHKIALEGFIPDGSQLKISCFSHNDEHAWIDGVYRKIDDFISDEALSYRQRMAGLATFWSQTEINPKDMMIKKAKGRYLWLKLEWLGTERYTPLLEKLRIYYPRETYLSYLPAVYQEDDESRDFLERYLSLFGTLFSDLEEQIDDFSQYIDPRRAAGEHLRWLATWVGLETDDNWKDEQVQAFIQASPELYRYRGTREGLLKTIEIYSGQRPFIVEYYQTKGMRDHAELRSLSEGLYGDDPYTFTVLLRPEQAPTEKERAVIEQLLEEQKPAYTEAKLVMLQPWMYLDMHTYLGINTALSEPSLFKLNPERSMPNDTLIVDVGMEKRMDVHTRLELDSELD
ncbi:phage tail protein [Paenibacillus sp. HB172176]|uniref:phage tail protein n=1 Tax=Paenibacillus sp. HB172176 TaxID=2493690 RepID=UPI00143C8510|nr:phage tail protein [Paenibacillus sp. HB172176]